MSIKQFRLSGHARKQLIRLKTRTALAPGACDFTQAAARACAPWRRAVDVRGLRRLHRQAQAKGAALADLLSTTMSPPCSRRILRLTARPRPVPARPLGADERLEDVVSFSGGNADAVVADRDPHPCRRLPAAWRPSPWAFRLFDGVQGVADDVQQGAVQALAVGRHDRQVVGQLASSSTLRARRPAAPAVRRRRGPRR